MNIILSFYHKFKSDEWDAECIGPKMILNQEDNSISHSVMAGHDSIYLKNIIDSGIFDWKFKLLNVGGDSWNSIFGIWPLSDRSEEKQRELILNRWFGNEGHGYNFWAKSTNFSKQQI